MVSPQAVRITSRKKYHAVQLLQALDAGIPESFSAFGSTVLQEPKTIIVSCAGIPSIPEKWAQAFSFLNKQLKPSGKDVRVVFANEEIEAAIAKSSDGSPIKTYISLSAAMVGLEDDHAPHQSMHYIKAFVAAALRTFYIQTQFQCKQGKIHILESNASERLLGDVSGFILVEAAVLSYVLILSFPKDTFLGIMSKMLGETYTEITPDITDGGAELLNIIFGQAKLVLNHRNAGIKPRIPSLVVGKADERVLKTWPLLKSGKVLVVPFASPVGEFFIQVCFSEEFAATLLQG